MEKTTSIILLDVASSSSYAGACFSSVSSISLKKSFVDCHQEPEKLLQKSETFKQKCPPNKHKHTHTKQGPIRQKHGLLR